MRAHFPLQRGHERRFCFRCHNDRLYRLLLPKAIKPSHCLIEIFKAIGETDECRIVTMLPIQAIASNPWFSDNDPDLSIGKCSQLTFFLSNTFRTTYLNSIRDALH